MEFVSRVSVICLFLVASCPALIKTELQSQGEPSTPAPSTQPQGNQTTAPVPTPVEPESKTPKDQWGLECTRDSCPMIKCNATQCSYPPEFDGLLAYTRSVLGRAEGVLITISTFVSGMSHQIPGATFLPKVMARFLVGAVEPSLRDISDAAKRMLEYHKHDVLAPLVEAITKDLQESLQVVEGVVRFLQDQGDGRNQTMSEAILKRLKYFHDWAPTCVGAWPCLRIVTNSSSTGASLPSQKSGFCLGPFCIGGTKTDGEKGQETILMQNQSSVNTSSGQRSQALSFDNGARDNLISENDETGQNANNNGPQTTQSVNGQGLQDVQMNSLNQDTLGYDPRPLPGANPGLSAGPGLNVGLQPQISSSNPAFLSQQRNNAGFLQAQPGFNQSPRIVTYYTVQRAPGQYQVPGTFLTVNPIPQTLPINDAMYQRIPQPPPNFIQTRGVNTAYSPNFLSTQSQVSPVLMPNNINAPVNPNLLSAQSQVSQAPSLINNAIYGGLPQTPPSSGQQMSAIRQNTITLDGQSELQQSKASPTTNSVLEATNFGTSSQSSFNPSAQGAGISQQQSSLSFNLLPQATNSFNTGEQLASRTTSIVQEQPSFSINNLPQASPSYHTQGQESYVNVQPTQQTVTYYEPITISRQNSSSSIDSPTTATIVSSSSSTGLTPSSSSTIVSGSSSTALTPSSSSTIVSGSSSAGLTSSSSNTSAPTASSGSNNPSPTTVSSSSYEFIPTPTVSTLTSSFVPSSSNMTPGAGRSIFPTFDSPSAAGSYPGPTPPVMLALPLPQPTLAVPQQIPQIQPFVQCLMFSSFPHTLTFSLFKGVFISYSQVILRRK